MKETMLRITWVLVGWIAFGVGQFLDVGFAKLFLLATARVLP